MSIKDTKKFHLTTTKELLAVKDRVRNLIDHWGEDGKYKEAILKTIIKRFLPEKFSIATGFVVRQLERGKHEPSPQIDIIIYDNSFPTLFKEGDFAIVTPDSVKAIIEVKANLKNQKKKKVIQRANKIGKFIYEGKMKAINDYYQSNRESIDDKYKSKLFNGIFSYTGFNKGRNFEILKNYILSESIGLGEEHDYEYYCINHICFNKDIFYKFWHSMDYDRLYHRQAMIYKIRGLAFSYFISNLLDYLTDSTMYNRNIWFPVDKSFEEKVRFKFEN